MVKFQKGSIMTIDPTKQLAGSSAAQGSLPAQQTRGKKQADAAEIGKALTKNSTAAAKNTGNMPETQGEKTGGLIFAKGTLKNLETKEERYKDKDGVFQTKTVYKATLTDGTVVEYEKQKPIKGDKGAYHQPQILKNKDGSFDFEGLQHAKIYDTAKNDKYNIIGGKDVIVKANRGNDEDVIDNANLRLSDGTTLRSIDVWIGYNKGDKVADLYSKTSSVNTPQTKSHDGVMLFENDLLTDHLGTTEPTAVFGMREIEYLENKRQRITETTEQSTVSATYSHDGKKLREDYVNATEQVLADGYKIKTSPDGKTQWFYTPDGKAISKEEFKNRGLE